MDEHRKRTEIKLIILAIFLVIAGISVVVFLSVSGNFISLQKDWSLVLLVFFIIIAPMLIWILFPALLGEPFFTRTRAEWDDPFERGIILDLPFQSAFDRCLDSVSLLMMGRTFDSLMMARDARIIVNDRKNGVITVITNDKRGSFTFSHSWFGVLTRQSTVTWSLKRLEHSQTLVQVKSSRTPENIPTFHINEEIVNTVCEFLLSHK